MDFTNLLGQTTSNMTAAASSVVAGNWAFLILGIILIVATIAILYFLKQVLVNSAVGLVAWIIVTYGLPFFGVELSLPFLPSLVVSAIFGLAGIGAMIVLAFMGLI